MLLALRIATQNPQFSEAALVRSVRSGEKVPLLWGWLCAQRQSVKYDLMLFGRRVEALLLSQIYPFEIMGA